MTDAAMTVIDLAAVAAVVVLPFLVVALARWAEDGPAGRSVAMDAWLVPVLALLSGAAGLLHLLVIEEHLRENAVHAVLFAGLAAFQIGWAAWFGLRPGRSSAWVGLMVNAGAVAVWAVSRTVGLPDWFVGGGGIEPVGLPDVACTLMELALVVGLLAMVWRPMRARVVDGRSVSRADAGLAITMVSLAVVLVTLGAIADIAAAGPHGHDHDAGHEAGVHAQAG